MRPDTILRWHRDLLARRLAARPQPKRPGVYATKPRAMLVQDNHFAATDSVPVIPRTTAPVDAALLRVAIDRPDPANGLPSRRSTVDSTSGGKHTAEELLAHAVGVDTTFAYLADSRTMPEPEHTLVCVNLSSERALEAGVSLGGADGPIACYNANGR